jgi:RiboL-PSP-HEPN
LNPAISSRKRQLDAYFQRATDPKLAEEIQSDLAKHGIVLICGFIERSVEIVIMERIENRAHPRVANFIRGHFRRGTNYDCEAISQLLDRFDLTWGEKFRQFRESRDDLVQAIGSVYTLRNSVAHGGSGNQGILGVAGLYIAAQEVIDGLLAAIG